MRLLLSCTALALVLSLSPASAMCGSMGGQQASSSGQGGMCGRPAAAAEDPFGQKLSQPQQQQTGMGMCPCCKGMAMMRGGMPMQGDDPHKGMDMPKQ